MMWSLPPSAFHLPATADAAAAAGGRTRSGRYLLLWMHSAEPPSAAEAGTSAWTRSVVYARNTLTGQVRRLEVLSRRPPNGPPDDGEPPAPAAAQRLGAEPSPHEDFPLRAAA